MNDSSNSPANQGRHRRRSRLPLIAALVLVVAGAATWYGIHVYKAKQAAKGEYNFATVEKGDVEDLVSSTGTLQPRDYVDVGAQVSGQIEDIFVEVGDEVVAGQKLVTIDATTSKARVDANKAQMEVSKTNLLTAIANLEKNTRDLERQKNLFKEDATTKESLLNAQTAYDNAVRSVETSKLSIAQNEANQRIEAKNLQFTTIEAPIAGTVMKISVKKGQSVNASQNVPNVLQIANLGTMTVQADVSEADVARLYKGIPVYFTTLSGNNRRWYSTLKRVEPTPKTQNSVVLYNALFDIANEGDLRPSMTAQIYFVSAEARNVVLVPMAALQLGSQISRELAAKEQNDGKKPAAATAPGAPGAAPGAAAANTAAGAARPGAAAPAAAGGSAPAVAQNGAAQGNRAANGQGAPGGFGGQRPGGNGGAGGNFNGPRPGGAGGFANMTPEQREEMMRRFQQGGGGGGFGNRGGAGGGGFGNRNGQVMSAAGGAPRPAQRRPGTVMVKKADGTLEARRVVVGVTDRVRGEVLEGLKEGEVVVVGKHVDEAAAAARPAGTNNQNQNFNQGNRNNNFPGGGNFRPF